MRDGTASSSGDRTPRSLKQGTHHRHDFAIAPVDTAVFRANLDFVGSPEHVFWYSDTVFSDVDVHGMWLSRWTQYMTKLRRVFKNRTGLLSSSKGRDT